MSRHTSLGPGREFDLVRALQEVWGDAACGLGDDAAVWPLGGHTGHLVASTDTSVEDVHFRRSWITLEEAGYRAAMSALSDLAAMAATPLGMLVAIVVPRGDTADVLQLAAGIGLAARDAECPIAGGDLTSGEGLSIGVTTLGTAERPLRRNGLRRGDGLYVTGVLSGPGRAVHAWRQGELPDEWCRSRFARPRARLREALWLAAHGATAMIDISDGLGSELAHLAHASGAQLRIDVDAVPCGPGGTWRQAVAGGEEYELLLGASPLEVRAFEAQFGLPLTRIGEVVDLDGAQVVAQHGAAGPRVDLAPGHDHFSG